MKLEALSDFLLASKFAQVRVSSLKLHLGGEEIWIYENRVNWWKERNATDVRWTLANTDHRKDNKIGINGWENLSRLFFINFK